MFFYDLPKIKILSHKCAISWKRLIVERNRWKIGTHGPAFVGCFSCLILWIQFRVIRCTSCKISDVNIFKSLLLPQISSNINQTLENAWNTGHYFFWRYVKFWREVTSATLCHYPWSYVGFIWKKVIPDVKAPGPLVYVTGVFFEASKPFGGDLVHWRMFWKLLKKIPPFLSGCLV